MKYRKLIAAFCAFCFALTVVSCGKNSDNSSSESTSSVAESSSVADSSSSESQADSSASDESQVQNAQGKLIKKAYDFFSGDKYTIKVKYTDEDGIVTNVTRAVSGDKFYQLQQIGKYKCATVSDGTETYDLDYACGIFRKSQIDSLDTIVKSVVDNNLPMTTTHLGLQDTEKYDVEEYTFTGDTYITVMDFSFDKKTGDLVKYTTTYSVEGKDDVVETREYTEMKADADESLFNTASAKKLTDFNSLTEDERFSFCKKVCVERGVTSDNISESGLTYDDFKTISYDDFTSLIYAYGSK